MIPPALLILGWAVLGLAVGSFLNVVADRLPADRSIVSPPSRCESCQRQLTPLELIPVVSYLALRGRCRTCGAAVGLRTLLVELGTGTLFALAAWQVPLPPSGRIGWLRLALLSAYISTLLIATVTDLEHGLILDRVTYPALGLALLGAALTAPDQLASHVVGGLIGGGTIALIILAVPGGMGWGDAKLAAFIGMITGLPGILFALFVAFVSGGLVAGALLALGRYERGDTIPLGPFLALGGAMTLFWGEEMVALFEALSALMG